MNIPESLPLLFRTLREEHRLSQAELAELAGLSQQFVSDLERGLCRGTRASLELLCKALGLDVDEAIRRTGWSPAVKGRPNRTLERRLEAAFAPPGLYTPPFERSVAQRLMTARKQYPDILAHLEFILSERRDLKELSAFMAEWPTESVLELLHLYWLCCLAMKGALLSPSRMGCSLDLYDWESRRHVGHLLMRSLAAELNGLSVVAWAQVPVRVRDAEGNLHHFRVDNLLGLMGSLGAVWCVLEVDGAGHDPRKDAERTALLGLPVLRVSEEELLREDRSTCLLRSLQQIYRDHAPSVRRRLVGRKPMRARRRAPKKKPTSGEEPSAA